jgi:hypothetical protein
VNLKNILDISYTLKILVIMTILVNLKIFASPGDSMWVRTGSSPNYNIYYRYTGGNVGIGIANPDARFVVRGGESQFAYYSYSDPNSGIAYDAKFGGNGNGIAVRGNSYFAGNIGIGTTNPGANRLAINSTSDCTMYLNSETGQTGIDIFRAGQRKWYVFNNPDDGNGHLDRLEFVANTTTRMTLDQDGTLRVPTRIRAGEVIVTTNVWADNVFKPDYNLKPLHEVEKYIKKNNNLEGIPSEKEGKENGLSMGAMQAKLLQKLEETTLYLIEMKKENESLKARLAAIEQKVR